MSGNWSSSLDVDQQPRSPDGIKLLDSLTEIAALVGEDAFMEWLPRNLTKLIPRLTESVDALLRTLYSEDILSEFPLDLRDKLPQREDRLLAAFRQVASCKENLRGFVLSLETTRNEKVIPRLLSLCRKKLTALHSQQAKMTEQKQHTPAPQDTPRGPASQPQVEGQSRGQPQPERSRSLTPPGRPINGPTPESLNTTDGCYKPSNLAPRHTSAATRTQSRLPEGSMDEYETSTLRRSVSVMSLRSYNATDEWNEAKKRLKIPISDHFYPGAYSLFSDSSRIIAGFADGSVRELKKETLHLRRLETNSHKVHGKTVISVQGSEAVVVSASWDGYIIFWDATSLKFIDKCRPPGSRDFMVPQQPQPIDVLKLVYPWLLVGLSTGHMALYKMEGSKIATVRHEFINQKGRIKGAAIDVRKQIIVSALQDGTITAWGMQTGAKLANWVEDSGINCMAYDNTKQAIVATGCENTTIGLWKLKFDSAELMAKLEGHNSERAELMTRLEGHQSEVRCVAMNENYVISGDKDGIINVWNFTVSPNPVCTVNRCSKGKITALLFNGTELIDSAYDNTIWRWDFKRLEQRWSVVPSTIRKPKLSVSHLVPCNTAGKYIGASCIQMDEEKIVAGFNGGVIKIWNRRNFACTRLQAGIENIECLQFNATKLIAGSYDGNLYVFRITTTFGGETIEKPFAIRVSHRVTSLKFCGFLLAVGTGDGNGESAGGKVCSFAMSAYGNEWTGGMLGRHNGRVTAIDLSPDYIISGSLDKTIKVWDRKSGRFVRKLEEGHEAGIRCLSYFEYEGFSKACPLLKFKLVVSGGEDKTLRIWNVETGAQLRCLKHHKGEVRHVVADPLRIVSSDKCRGLNKRLSSDILWWDVAYVLDLNVQNPAPHMIETCAHNVKALALHKNELARSSAVDDKIKIWQLQN